MAFCLMFALAVVWVFACIYELSQRCYTKIKRAVDVVRKEFQDLWDEFGDKVIEKFSKNKCQCLCGCNNKAEDMEDKCLFCLEYHGDTYFEQQ